MTTVPDEHCKLSDVAEVFLGFNPSRKVHEASGSLSAQFLQVKDVVDQRLPLNSAFKEIHLPSTTNFSRQLLQLGDVVVSVRGTLLKCAIIEQLPCPLIASANFVVVRTNSEVLKPRALWAYLCSESVQSYMQNRSTGTVQSSINISDIKDIELSLPPMETQAKIDQMLAASEQQYEHAQMASYLRRHEALDISATFLHVTNNGQ